MFDTLRNNVAKGFEFLAQRVSTEPRYIDKNRVPTTIKTTAGVSITPDTAVTIAAVWACLRYLSQTVAVLPWHVMKDGDKGAEVQARNPLDYVLSKRPSSEYSSFQFREMLTHWALRWGNGYAEIEPDTLDRPYAMWPLHSSRVDVCRSVVDGYDSHGDEIPAGALFYEVNNGVGGKTTLAARRMFHIRGFGEGPVGVNVITYAAQSLGWAKAAQLFGSSFFGQGAVPTTVVKNKRALSPEALRLQKAEFNQLYRGPEKSNRTAFTDNDTEIQVISLNAEQTQLIETQQFLVEEICRWFGVPPHKIMHLLRATFSNIEHQSIEVVVDSISPWVKRFEDEADYKLFGQNRQGLYTKMNMRALLRGDAASRIAYYDGMVKIGAYSPNRVLELEDENTLGKEGDIHVMQSQNVTLETIANPPEPPAAPTPEPAPDASSVAAMADFERIMAREHA